MTVTKCSRRLGRPWVPGFAGPIRLPPLDGRAGQTIFCTPDRNVRTIGGEQLMAGVSPVRCRVVGTPVSYGLATFKDRHQQLAQILTWLADPGTRMITVVGRRGIGKSSLAAKAVEVLASTDSGCSAVVNLSTRTEGPLTIERIFFTCAELAAPAEKEMLYALWGTLRSPRDKLLELFAAMGEGTHVIVLDNIEDQLSDDGHPENADLELFLDVVFRAKRAPRLLVTTQVPIDLDPALGRLEARLRLDSG